MFCGRADQRLTKEHVFADWISELFGREPGSTYELMAPDGGVTTFSQTLFQHRIRAVCASCNHGWMSELEATVKPFLGRMILNGAETALPPEQQKSLATWAVKTQLVMDRLHPNYRVVPDSEAAAFYAAQEPLPTHFVLTAQRTGYMDETNKELIASAVSQSATALNVRDEIVGEVARDIPEWRNEGKNVYFTTFAVGRAVFQVFGHNLPVKIEFFDIDDLPFVSRIWRTQDRTVIWPPAAPVDPSIRVFHAYFKVPPVPTSGD